VVFAVVLLLVVALPPDVWLPAAVPLVPAGAVPLIPVAFCDQANARRAVSLQEEGAPAPDGAARVKTQLRGVLILGCPREVGMGGGGRSIADGCHARLPQVVARLATSREGCEWAIVVRT